jgi:DNA-binding MarR family transcriptional regulator
MAMTERDSIDGFIETALQHFPEIDPEIEGVVDRIWKLSKNLDHLWDATAERSGLGQGGEYKVLLALRQAPEGRSTPSGLAERLSLSTGAMTNRLDRLEHAGMIVRERDPRDRRSVLVHMTDKGRRVFDEAVRAEAKEEERIVGVLSPAEQRRLNALLRRLVLAFERDA